MPYLYLLAAAWGFVWWRLRGGAFTALTGFDPGTGGMRAIAAVAMAGPLAAVHLWAALLIPALWVGWSIAGWGAFQDMGADGGAERPNHPISDMLTWCGLKPASLAHDLIGMSAAGIICMAPSVAVLAWLAGWAAVIVVLAGLVFGPLYLAAARLPWVPDCGRFARGRSEWGECLVGAIVMPALLAAVELAR